MSRIAMLVGVWGFHALLLAGSGSAQAPAPVRAHVVMIDRDEIVVDLGGPQLTAAEAPTVYRTLEVRHPITRKVLRDRFAIGTLTLVQAGETLSVMRLSGNATHPVRVGDTVELAERSATGAAESPSASVLRGSVAPLVTSRAPPADRPAADSGRRSGTDAAAPAQTSALEREMLAYWYATLSQTPARRAELYRQYLVRNPESFYAKFVANELAYLRRLDAQLKHPQATPAPAPARPAALEMLPLTGATEGGTVEVAARVRKPNEVSGMLLHVRALPSRGFRSVRMEVDARGHARARVPSDLVRAPGFAYFVEAIGTDGQPGGLVGSAREPKVAVVRSTRRPQRRAERAMRVHFSSELASFDGTSGRDYFLINEGDFLYRIKLGPLYGVRMGYGYLGGEGGTVDELDVQALAPRPAGFSYGFCEAELALHPLFGAAIRGTIGLGRPDDPGAQANGLTGGIQLRARIGEAEATHLVLAGELMPEIGQRAYIGLVWEILENVPMATEIVVTDQPVNSDELAVRLVVEAGYRFSDQITVSLRPSYQLRTIRHAGPGIGLAATFDW